MTTDEAPADELGRRVVSGARWVLLLRLGSTGTLWAISISLARLLDRAEFGVAGLVTTFLTILLVFQESGVTAALIHRADRMQEAIDSAVVYTAAACSMLAILCLLTAPVVGNFFHQSELTDLVRAVALVFVLRGISTVPQAILQREMRFKAWSLILLTGTVIQGCVAIVLAATGAGAWSIVIGTIALEGWCALLAWPVTGIRTDPRRASWRIVRELASYGRGVVGANVANTIYSYIDNVVIARTLGPASLGAYTIGYQMGKRPVLTLTSASNALVFPAYTRLRNDPDRLRVAYLRSLRFIITASAPIGLGLAAVSGTFIHVVYGARWHAAAPVMAIIALMGVVLSISATMGEVMKATGHPGWLFALAAIETVLVALAVLSLYPYGITAVAAGVAIPVTLNGWLALWRTGLILAISPRQWLDTLAPSLVAGTAMAMVLLGTDHVLTSIPPAVRLVLEAIEALVVYAIGLRLIAGERFAEFVHELDKFSAISVLRVRLGRAVRRAQ